jgi:predicted deacylase
VIVRGALRLEGPRLEGLELPLLEARAGDGPRVALIAGVHGCEYASIAALGRFMHGLDRERLAGSIVAVPVVNLTAFRARSPFITPEDGKNLNRCFPGDAGGSFSEVLAHEVFERVIRPSDALIDLHGGDLVEALEPFTLYDESPVQERAHAMAVAFRLRYLIRTAAGEAIGGTTSHAAAAAGIPAITPEAGGCGRLDEPSIAAHVAGIENTLRMLRVLEGDPAPPPPGQSLVRRFVWLRSPVAGWWDAEAVPGQAVAAGDRLGAVRDLHGEELHVVESPEQGVIMFVTSSPAMAEDGILLAVGGGIEPL